MKRIRLATDRGQCTVILGMEMNFKFQRKLRWLPRLQVATACFSCSPPDLNFLDPYFIFMYTHYNHCHRATAHLQLNILLSSSSSSSSSSPLSPLCSVAIHIFPRQTMTLGDTLLQLFCFCCLWCLYF